MVDTPLASSEDVILTGGWSPEREENLVGAASVHRSLEEAGRGVDIVDIQTPNHLLGMLERLPQVEFAYLAHTEELPTIPLLDALGIAHSGPSWTSAVLSYDKRLTYACCPALGVGTPSYSALRKDDSLDLLSDLAMPCVVKPRRGGSSVGVEYVLSPDAVRDAVERALRLDDEVLIEEYLDGEEITVAAIGRRVLAIVSTRYANRPIYDQEAKHELLVEYEVWKKGDGRQARSEIERWTSDIGQLLGISGLWRTDYRMGNEGFRLLDVNVLPFLGCLPGGVIATILHEYGRSAVDLYRVIRRLGLGEIGSDAAIAELAYRG